MTPEETKVALDMLSPRERSIKDLILAGCDNADIAKQTGLSIRTVKSYTNRIYMRFHIAHTVPCVSRIKFINAVSRISAVEVGQRSLVHLGPKEWHIVKYVAEGLSNPEIGKATSTTEHVVKNYLRVIYDKIGVWNRTELTLWYLARKEDTNNAAAGAAASA